MFRRKQTFSTAGVARLFEKVSGIEIRKQIRCGLLIKVAQLDIPLAHRRPHSRRVIPHGRGERRRSEVAIDAAPEVGRERPALSVDAVAFDAGKRFEQRRAASRIRRDGRSVEGRARQAVINQTDMSLIA